MEGSDESATYDQAFVEFLIDVTYRHGFEDGVEWADTTMEASLRLAIDPGPHVNPGARRAILERTAKQAVDLLLAKLSIAERRPAPAPSRPDYEGGTVAEW